MAEWPLDQLRIDREQPWPPLCAGLPPRCPARHRIVWFDYERERWDSPTVTHRYWGMCEGHVTRLWVWWSEEPALRYVPPSDVSSDRLFRCLQSVARRHHYFAPLDSPAPSQ